MLYNWGQPDRLDTILDTCIDQLEFESPEELLRRYPQAAPKLAPMLHVAAALGEMRDVHLSASANERNRARLRQAVTSKRRRRVTVFTPNLTRAVAYAATLIALFGGSLSWMTVASANALPNERLYSWKRSSENVWLSVQRSPEAAAAVSLGLAERRAAEVSGLYERTGRVDADVVAQLGLEYTRALSYIAAAPADQSAQLLQQLHTLGTEHTTQFTALAQESTGDARDQLLTAVAASSWVQTALPAPAVTPPPPSITDDLENVQPSPSSAAEPQQPVAPAASNPGTENGKAQAPGQEKKQPAQENTNNAQPGNANKPVPPGQAKPNPTPPGATNQKQPPGQNKEPQTPAKPATAAPSDPPGQENKPPKDEAKPDPKQPAVEVAPTIAPVPAEPVVPVPEQPGNGQPDKDKDKDKEPVVPVPEQSGNGQPDKDKDKDKDKEPVVPVPEQPDNGQPGNGQPDKDKDKDKNGNGNSSPTQSGGQPDPNGQPAEPKVEPTPEVAVEQPVEEKPKENGNGGGQGKKP